MYLRIWQTKNLWIITFLSKKTRKSSQLFQISGAQNISILILRRVHIDQTFFLCQSFFFAVSNSVIRIFWIIQRNCPSFASQRYPASIISLKFYPPHQPRLPPYHQYSSLKGEILSPGRSPATLGSQKRRISLWLSVTRFSPRKNVILDKK